MATWVAAKIAGSNEVSYINTEHVAYVMTSNQNCQVNFVGDRDHHIIIEGDADKIVNSIGGPTFDTTI